jgi:5S rRNA maturation endonuclease (ribonuclease M5)
MVNTKSIHEQLNEHIKKLQQSNALIIVEGKKDKAALATLGIENTFSLDRWPLYKVIEHIASQTKDCIILTDLDNEGKKLYAALRKGVTEHGVRVDNTFREFLFRHTSLRQIEGIDTFYHNLHR